MSKLPWLQRLRRISALELWRAVVVILLGVIVLQLGGWNSIRETVLDLRYWIQSIGVPEEGPAVARPGTPSAGGILDLHAEQLRESSMNAIALPSLPPASAGR